MLLAGGNPSSSRPTITFCYRIMRGASLSTHVFCTARALSSAARARPRVYWSVVLRDSRIPEIVIRDQKDWKIPLLQEQMYFFLSKELTITSPGKQVVLLVHLCNYVWITLILSRNIRRWGYELYISYYIYHAVLFNSFRFLTRRDFVFLSSMWSRICTSHERWIEMFYLFLLSTDRLNSTWERKFEDNWCIIYYNY